MLNKRFINATFLIGDVALSFLITSCDKPEDHSSVKPNIVFIYTDDQAPWALGTSGNSQIHTSNMDKLAKEGAYFKNSFITSPARVSLMTGQYASEYGVYDFIPAPGHGLYNPDVELGLSPESITEILQNKGYTTGLVGKWHVAPHHKKYLGWSPNSGPSQQGIDRTAETFDVQPYGSKNKERIFLRFRKIRIK